MIATITLQFYYNEKEYASPDKWVWGDILDLVDVNSIRVKSYSEDDGNACYFCGDPVKEPKWFEDDDLGKVPFHAGCYPPKESQ